MELYYKDLISKDAVLESLVDNVTMVVQGADEFAQEAGARVSGQQREELALRLQRLKDGCHQIKEQTKATALATDRVIRRYPYQSAGLALVAGVLLGALLMRSSCSKESSKKD